MAETLALKSKHFQNPDNRMHEILANLVGIPKYDNDSLRQRIQDLHSDDERFYPWKKRHLSGGEPPRIIFITATSAVAYAFAIKEAWKVAFTDPVPKFFTIDVSRKRFSPDFEDGLRPDQTGENLARVEEEDIERLKKLGKKYDAFDNAALFDEFNRTGTTLTRAETLLEKAGFDNLKVMAGQWGHVVLEEGIPIKIRPMIRSTYKEGLVRILMPHITPESRDVIYDMKAVGRVMGNEIIRRQALAEHSC
jgi:hypothetical protein